MHLEGCSVNDRTLKGDIQKIKLVACSSPLCKQFMFMFSGSNRPDLQVG